MHNKKIIILSFVLIVFLSNISYAAQESFNNDRVVIVEGGQFLANTTDEYYNQQKGNNVKVNNFYISRYELTHKEYIEFLNNKKIGIDGKYNGHKLIDLKDRYCAIGYKDKFYFKSSDIADQEECPVVEITWWGAIEYCNWLSEKSGLRKAYNSDGYLLDKSGDIVTDIAKVEGYRLPTKTEWEYAASGGKKGRDTFYAGSNSIDRSAWYWENSEVDNFRKAHPVGKKAANELGLYDMSGNVAEWTNTKKDANRIFMNGSWDDLDIFCELGFWDYDSPSISKNMLGFRFARTKLD